LSAKDRDNGQSDFNRSYRHAQATVSRSSIVPNFKIHRVSLESRTFADHVLSSRVFTNNSSLTLTVLQLPSPCIIKVQLVLIHHSRLIRRGCMIIFRVHDLRITRRFSWVHRLQDLVADESFRPMALTVEELDVRVCTGDAVEFVGVAVMVRAEVARALREHGRGGGGGGGGGGGVVGPKKITQ